VRLICSQVLHGRRWLTKQVEELNSQIKMYMNKHPITAAHAKEPTLTYLVYGALALALLIVWFTITAFAGRAPLLCCSMRVLLEHTFEHTKVVLLQSEVVKCSSSKANSGARRAVRRQEEEEGEEAPQEGQCQFKHDWQRAGGQDCQGQQEGEASIVAGLMNAC
jgi:hypothetical protein